MSIHTVANVVAEEILGGGSSSIRSADARHQLIGAPPAAVAEEAEKAAYISVGIPGAKAHATAAGNMALDIIEYQ